jgi:prolyl oligopeptidase
MRKIFSLSLILLSTLSFAQFPATKKTPTVTSKFGITLTDDYTWLQQMNSAETQEWIATQNQVTEAALTLAKKEYDPAFKIKEYDYLSSNPIPVRKEKYFYSRYRTDKNYPAALYYRKTLTDKINIIVDPYSVTKNKNVVLGDYEPSKSSLYMAYMLSRNGGDRQEIRFAPITASQKIEDVITDVKFSNISWNRDQGIFYNKNLNKSTFARDSTYQLYYHRIGTDQSADKLIMDASKKDGSISFHTRDNYLFVTESNRKDAKSTYYYCFLDDDDFELVKFYENDISGFEFLGFSAGRVYYNSGKFDWGDIRSFDLKNPEDDKPVVPQLYQNLLVSVTISDDLLFCRYKTVGKNYLIVYDKAGKFVRKFDAPHAMDFNLHFYLPETKELFVSFYSHVISFQNFKLNIETGEANNYYNDFIRPKVLLFPLDHFETKSITYKSRDSVDVPITIIYKKGTKLDGNNPTLLKAYGGFGNVSGPHYDTGILYFLEKGGVYAFAEVRGGGEKGKQWHRDGRDENKPNAIHDFVDAAEFLIREKYTSPEKLAITGGSHGGLVVGGAMIERPELFKVAIPVAGRLDVLTLEEYTAGKWHLKEYGNPNDAEDYKRMVAYSPYQNIKEDVNYPITLIYASENDDRVPPLQSYKFAARLQNRAAQKNPIYLRTQYDAGHEGKISTYKDRIDADADFYGFLLYTLME